MQTQVIIPVFQNVHHEGSFKGNIDSRFVKPKVKLSQAS